MTPPRNIPKCRKFPHNFGTFRNLTSDVSPHDCVMRGLPPIWNWLSLLGTALCRPIQFQSSSADRHATVAAGCSLRVTLTDVCKELDPHSIRRISTASQAPWNSRALLARRYTLLLLATAAPTFQSLVACVRYIVGKELTFSFRHLTYCCRYCSADKGHAPSSNQGAHNSRIHRKGIHVLFSVVSLRYNSLSVTSYGREMFIMETPTKARRGLFNSVLRIRVVFRLRFRYPSGSSTCSVAACPFISSAVVAFVGVEQLHFRRS